MLSYIQKLFTSRTEPALVLFNTLTKRKESFTPRTTPEVTIYSCGPTVYNRIHVGNLRAFVFDDLLNRTLRQQGYIPRHVINITDVGHLTDDADAGVDKLEKAAAETSQSAQEIAQHYTDLFFTDLMALNVPLAHYDFPRATAYIDTQISFIQELEKKGHTYTTSDGIYFDTATFPQYGKLGNIPIDELKEGARVAANEEKKHPTDFALWKLSGDEKRQQEWDSPWGAGFPGWHIECSAMSHALLGDHIDIHTGGEDHISIHHNNEIAQSESALGTPFVKYWLHNAFLTFDTEKMSKSIGNVVTVADIEGQGIDSRALRYFFLEAHYRTPQSFTWEALEASAHALTKLERIYRELSENSGDVDARYKKKYLTAITNDIHTPSALAVLWEVAKDSTLAPEVKKATMLYIDEVLGLGFSELFEAAIPEKIHSLLEKREALRKSKKFDEADVVREEIESLGFMVRDTPQGAKIEKK